MEYRRPAEGFSWLTGGNLHDFAGGQMEQLHRFESFSTLNWVLSGAGGLQVAGRRLSMSDTRRSASRSREIRWSTPSPSARCAPAFNYMSQSAWQDTVCRAGEG